MGQTETPVGTHKVAGRRISLPVATIVSRSVYWLELFSVSFFLSLGREQS